MKNTFSTTQVGESIASITQKQRIEAAMRELCEEVKKPSITDGYIHLRMRAILGGSRYSYLLLPMQKLSSNTFVENSRESQEMVNYIDSKQSHQKLVKFVFNSWLIINGLKLSK